MKSKLLWVATLVAAVVPVRANATVEGYIDFTVPYFHVQSGDICLRQHPMIGEFGIPQANVMQGTLSEAKVLLAATGQHININLVATQPPLKGIYVSDNLTQDGFLEYTMKLDVGALALSNGTTTVGRANTVLAAKLFLLSMSENMQRLSPNKWRLRVEFLNLPSQTGLDGTRLYATTVYAYGPSSPLLASYRRELINKDGSCP